jgi:O-antigen biosynthesis protein WbqP
MKRLLDIIVCCVLLVFTLVPMLLIALVIKATSKGPVLYVSSRVGCNNRLFEMLKFRTMQVNTPAVATHLLQDPKAALTPVGSFLRTTSLDELPQLFNILAGEMSLVGPRPALFNQEDLILLRTQQGIHNLVPGLTGWAQVNGRDELSTQEKVKLDQEYLINRSFFFDMKIIYRTLIKVLHRDGVSH